MDRDVIRAAKLGDVDARETLGGWVFELLYRTFSSRVARRELDDLIQETVKDIFAKLESHAPPEPEEFRQWVLSFGGMEVRAAWGESKRERGRAAKLREHAQVKPSPRRSDSSRVAQQERRQVMMRLVFQLPEIYREALLHYLRGGSHSELAQREGITLETARQRLWQGKRLLRQLLDDKRVTRTPYRSPRSA